MLLVQTSMSHVILGIPIPSDDPAFLGTLVVHVPAGMVCVIAGLIAMLSTKRPGPHPNAGSGYYWSLLVVFVTSTVLSVLRWDEDYHLFILGVLSFAAASIGRIARRHRPPRLVVHVIGMGTSYVLLLTAFYVDNGKNLPVWRELPQFGFCRAQSVGRSLCTRFCAILSCDSRGPLRLLALPLSSGDDA